MLPGTIYRRSASSDLYRLVDWSPTRITDDLYPGKLPPNLHAYINFLVGRIMRRWYHVYMLVYDVTTV